jgi:hypothetical protein
MDGLSWLQLQGARWTCCVREFPVSREIWQRICSGAPVQPFASMLIMPADSSARLQALTGKHASPAAAAEHLEKMFSEEVKHESSRVTVLLVDEMDLLITKKQQVCFGILLPLTEVDSS